MPRRKSEIINFREQTDASVQEVLDALNTHSEEALSRLDEGNDTQERILKGHETHTWDNEIELEGA